MKTSLAMDVTRLYSSTGNEITKLYTNTGAVAYTKGTTAPLRHIKVGDNLSGKKIYFTYPSTYFGNQPEGSDYSFKRIIACGSSNYFGYVDTWEEPNLSWMQELDIIQNDNPIVTIMHIDRWGLSEWYDVYYEYVLPNDFGTVTSILTNYSMYNYIWIEETLQNIAIGDDLSGKTLYCSFPNDFYNYYMEYGNVIVGAGTNRITEDRTDWARGTWTRCFIYPAEINLFYYDYTIESDPPTETYENHATVTCPSDFGTVVSVNMGATSYEFIKIYK